MLPQINENNFQVLIQAILDLRNAPSFICETSDGGFVCGDKQTQKYYKIFSRHHVYETVPEQPFEADFFAITPNVQFGVDFNDLIASRD